MARRLIKGGAGMKCKACNGTGKVRGYFYEKTDINKWEKVWGDSPCDECNGTGQIEMTNEEWFDTLSTTEEKAEAIYKCVMANSWSFSKDGIKRWLKRPHTDKE